MITRASIIVATLLFSSVVAGPCGAQNNSGYFNQPFGAPGSVQQGFGSRAPGTYYMRNQPGVGFYSTNPGYPGYPTYSNYPAGYPGGYPGGYPAYGLPTAVGGGYFGFRTGGVQVNMWKAPSGYYYPWANRSYYGSMMPPVVIVQQGVSTPSLPPISTVFSDLNKYLEEAKAGNKLADGDYQHLARRLKDIMSKESTQRLAAGGVLDEGQEQDIRKDLDQLNNEVAQRSKI